MSQSIDDIETMEASPSDSCNAILLGYQQREEIAKTPSGVPHVSSVETCAFGLWVVLARPCKENTPPHLTQVQDGTRSPWTFNAGRKSGLTFRSMVDNGCPKPLILRQRSPIAERQMLQQKDKMTSDVPPPSQPVAVSSHATLIHGA